MTTQPLIVDIFVSVDGWARGKTSPGYYGYLGPDLQKWITDELAKPQLIILGRRTYEALAGLPAEARDESLRRMSELDKVVFSTTLTTVTWPNTRICGADLVTEISRLKRESDVPLRTMGSLNLAKQLIDAGLVDRLRLMTFPLLVGPTGIEPAFGNVGAADLELVSHEALDKRILLVEYRPTGRDIPRA